MSRRGGGGGGRRGSGSYDREPQPGAPSSGQRGGRGGGRGRGGGGRGGLGEGSAPPPPRREQYVRPPAAAHSPPPPSQEEPQMPADPSPSAVSATAASLCHGMERQLSITEPVEAGTSGSSAPPPPAAATAAAMPPASSKALRHPPRPGFGTQGRKCMVKANHFLVGVADRDLFHYDVAINPESTSRIVNRNVIRELVRLHQDSQLGRRLPAYDGRKSLYTAGAMPFTSKSFVIKLADLGRDGSVRREKEYTVTIKLAGRPDLHHLQQFLRGKQMDAPQETIQALDVVLRESPSTCYTTVTRSFYSRRFGEPKDIGDGVECWRGYYQSLRPTQMGLSLNIDISATAFYKSIPVVDFVVQYLNPRDRSRPLSDLDRNKVKKALMGLRVEATHRPELHIRYKIKGITSIPMNQLMFDTEEGAERISVVQYFRQRYNYILQYVNWPCLQAGTDSRPTYLPMEVCTILGGQRYGKKLNERQVTEILRTTCKRPPERENNILQVVRNNKYNADKYAKEFGIQVTDQLAIVGARVLPPPILKYHDSGRERMCNPSVGQWNMINKKMVNGGTVEYWTCLNFSRLRQNEVFQFCDVLAGMCNSIGMVFNRQPFVDIQSARADNVEAALRAVHRQSTEKLARLNMQGKHIQLLIVILPEIKGLYGRIKRICETELGIISQCCAPKNLSKGSKQYLENVALKINVKVGGRNTVLEDAVRRNIPFVTDVPTIIFGADVTHPPPGDDSLSSIAAVVASMDWPEVTKYKGLVTAQQHREEMIQDLYTVKQDPQKGYVCGGMIRELLISFYKAMNRKPNRIIFYRDGVSESQFAHVLLHEMDAIRKACASLEEGYLPPVTFIVVQKRHHTRLFPQVHGDRNSTDRSGNILPGTVVDTTICHPTEFDFYLCSHAGIQGTSRPTHYHVLLDENKFSADSLQILTNNLCYTYARCTRSVSVVPPAYYAHLAAFRARYYLEADLSDGGSPSVSGSRSSSVVRQLPQIKDNVKDVMFFC